MPRTYGKSKGKAKQTRLSFVPTAFHSDDQAGDTDRHAKLRYEHPSMPTIRREDLGKDRKKRAGRRTPFVTVNPSIEESSQTEQEVSSQKHSRKKKKGSSRQKSSQNNSPPPPPTTQDSESDIELVRSARKSRIAQMLKRKRSSPTPEAEASPASQDSDADEIVTRPRRKLRRGGASQPITVVNESSEEGKEKLDEKSVISLSTDESRSDVPRTPRRNLGQDKLDIEEDLEDLQDSVVKESRTRGRLANSTRAQRQRHLQALRRRRAGKKGTDEEEEHSSSEHQASALSQSEEEEGEEEDAPVARQPRFRTLTAESDVESSIASDEDLDRYEDDFVLEDENDKLGVPDGLDGIPIEFSRHSYKQLKDYFQDAVEWMVHNQLNPAFPRSDPVYIVAFDKLEAEVKGRTGSQLVSSVWNSNFRRALLARPQIEITDFPTSECHPCDACNRSGHPASSDIKLYGKAYSLDTLEPLSDADSDEEQSGSEVEEERDGQERDRDGHVLPDEDTRFYLGRHCMTKARMAHTLTHWRVHLNEWVVDHLRILGYMADDKVVERSHWSQKRKNKHTAKAVESMINSGEVKKLWRDFHINLRTARESTTF